MRRAAGLYFPFGSGLGSFDPVYRAVEPLTAVTASYFNHAHDDALELLVETGAFGMAVLAAFALWWTTLTARLAVRGRGTGGVGLYASLAVAALVAHSLWTTRSAPRPFPGLFALACGLMAAPAVTPRPLAGGTRRP